jgi:thiol-disulfide isomerase/thioredoxin
MGFLFVMVIVLTWGTAHAQQEGFTPIPVIKGIDSLKPGAKAPLFAVKDLSGATFDLGKEVGTRAFMLVFWSIYCEPCREEMPLIEKLANQYKAKGMDIMTVNMDGDPFLDAVKGFIKQGKYSFRVLMDELQDDNFKIADPYNVAGTPVAYIINKAGNIVFTKVGRATEEELTAQIDKALNTP